MDGPSRNAPMSLARDRQRQFRIRYQLDPWGRHPIRTSAPIDVVLAMPRTEIHHEVTLTYWEGPQVSEQLTDERKNLLWKLRLTPGQAVTAVWDVCSFEVSARAGSPTLDIDIPPADCVGSPLCPVDDAMRTLIEPLLESNGDSARARRIFRFVSRELSYVYPPQERGAASVPHPVPWTHVCATPPGVARAPRAPRSGCDTRVSRAARSCCIALRTRRRRSAQPRGSERCGRESLAP